MALAVVLTLSPLALSADSFAVADDAACTAPSSSDPGVHVPTGSDATTFIYQCTGQYAGLYYNGYYTYSPATGFSTATFAPNYSYSCSTQKWTMDTYEYSPAQKTFAKNRVPASPAPNLPTNCPPPVVVAPPVPTSSVGTAPTVTIGTGSDAQTTTSTANALGTGTVNSNTLGMANTISSSATSGDATVLGNTFGGSASTGDASVQATIINMLQSSSTFLGANTALFTADINGDVNGDFMFDPAATLSNADMNTPGGTTQVNTNNGNATDAQISNDIDLSAASGDAKVAGNTSGGSATSGNATAILNLMNLINSTVAAGQSFIGTININGNLNGDILLPQNFIDQLLAASGANSPGSSGLGSSGVASSSNTSAINNSVNITAISGDALVTGNTNAGNATSGSAKTGVTILNMTGSNVIGKNDLLVFVNVLGSWVGMIVNAPSGSTSAELGGDITGSTPNTPMGTTTNTSSFGINNNVSVAAATGDATVTDNTTADDATSGNANTAVNILNMTSSNLSLSNWFGVLFINVFGNWTGSFGVNTAAGDSSATQQSDNTSTGGTQDATTSTGDTSGSQRFASFVACSTPDAATGSQASTDNTASSVLGESTTVAKKTAKIAAASLPSADNASHASFALPILGLLAAGVILLASEHGRLFGKKK